MVRIAGREGVHSCPWLSEVFWDNLRLSVGVGVYRVEGFEKNSQGLLQQNVLVRVLVREPHVWVFFMTARPPKPHP